MVDQHGAFSAFLELLVLYNTTNLGRDCASMLSLLIISTQFELTLCSSNISRDELEVWNLKVVSSEVQDKLHPRFL